jgi:hypothetical protein
MYFGFRLAISERRVPVLKTGATTQVVVQGSHVVVVENQSQVLPAYSIDKDVLAQILKKWGAWDTEGQFRLGKDLVPADKVESIDVVIVDTPQESSKIFSPKDTSKEVASMSFYLEGTRLVLKVYLNDDYLAESNGADKNTSASHLVVQLMYRVFVAKVDTQRFLNDIDSLTAMMSKTPLVIFK